MRDAVGEISARGPTAQNRESRFLAFDDEDAPNQRELARFAARRKGRRQGRRRR
jgi:hypothetical protein